MIALPSETTEKGGERPNSAGDRPAAASTPVPAGRERRKRPARPVSPHEYERKAVPLHEDAERLFTTGQHPEAERKVRRLLALQKRAVGRRHPDFALGLSMLGELRFVQNDLAGAEKLFRRALAIRGKVLGTQHPDYAVSLSCLGGVLWRQGGTEEAERRFREALAIRYAALGKRHPESIQTRKELARILRLRGDWAAAQALTADAMGIDLGRRDLTVDVAVLSTDLARLGETLASAARLMDSTGTPPRAADVEKLAACRRDYERLRDETLHRIEALDVPPPAPQLLGTLQDLAALLDDLAEAEVLQESREHVRRCAVAVLERILALNYFKEEDFPPLRECQERAEHLIESIEGEHWSALPTQSETLAEGTHALYSLLRLVEQPGSLSDAEWADLHEQVGEALGKPIASAASRARLIVAGGSLDLAPSPPPDPPRPPDPQPVRQEPPPPASPAVMEVVHESQAAPAPPAPSVRARTRSASRPQRQVTAPAALPATDPRVALMRDMAVASLVPTMGKVINLPSASPSGKDETHRLLRVGQAPNVVKPPTPAELEQARTSDLRRQTLSAEVVRRYATYRRIGGGVIAGPLSLAQPNDAAASLLAADALLDPQQLLGLMGLGNDDNRRW